MKVSLHVPRSVASSLEGGRWLPPLRRLLRTGAELSGFRSSEMKAASYAAVQ